MKKRPNKTNLYTLNMIDFFVFRHSEVKGMYEMEEVEIYQIYQLYKSGVEFRLLYDGINVNFGYFILWLNMRLFTPLNWVNEASTFLDLDEKITFVNGLNRI